MICCLISFEKIPSGLTYISLNLTGSAFLNIMVRLYKIIHKETPTKTTFHVRFADIYTVCGLCGSWQVFTQLSVSNCRCPYLHSPSNDDGEHVRGCPHVASFTAACLSLLVSARLYSHWCQSPGQMVARPGEWENLWRARALTHIPKYTNLFHCAWKEKHTYTLFLLKICLYCIYCVCEL